MNGKVLRPALSNDLLHLNLFSKNYNDFKICIGDRIEEPASKILNINLSNIPYALFTKNHSDLSIEEASQLSRYFANISYLLDAKDTCDKNGITYLAELFAFNCSSIKLGILVSKIIEEISAMIPDNDLAGLAYNMSGCNHNNCL
jgi:hypothetical protein